MNKIILCEGQTDAILLSYYLGKAWTGHLMSTASLRQGWTGSRPVIAMKRPAMEEP